jgi:hypothetical protein
MMFHEGAVTELLLRKQQADNSYDKNRGDTKYIGYYFTTVLFLLMTSSKRRRQGRRNGETSDENLAPYVQWRLMCRY